MGSCPVTGEIGTAEGIRSAALIAIAAAQAAGAFAVAKKQYDFAMEQFEFQKEVWETQKAWSQQYHDHWANVFRAYEVEFLSYIQTVKNYSPKYQAVSSRAVIRSRKKYSGIVGATRRAVDPRCTGFICHTEMKFLSQGAIEAANAAERGYQAETAKVEFYGELYEKLMVGALDLGRGLAGMAGGMLAGAAKSMANASNIDPYSGYAMALGNLSATVGNIFTDSHRKNITGEASSTNVMGMNVFGTRNPSVAAIDYDSNERHYSQYGGGGER